MFEGKSEEMVEYIGHNSLQLTLCHSQNPHTPYNLTSQIFFLIKFNKQKEVLLVVELSLWRKRSYEVEKEI